MKTRKTLLMVLSLVLVAVVSVAGTLAYLSKTTGTITNTFTVGNVDIALTEYKLESPTDTSYVDANKKGVSEGETQPYKVYPGKVISNKDGIVTIKEGSERCWVFVKVVETDPNSMLELAFNSDWTVLNTSTTEGVTTTILVYKNAAQGTENETFAADTDCTRVIETVTISNNLAAESDLSGTSIVLNAYAIQADNLSTATAAWTAGGWQ